ncbi:HcaE, Phenylpropionate dioxygenase, partial [Pyrenophora tritici-repentis]
AIAYWLSRYDSQRDLARFALDMFAISPMSDECERLFSSAKLTIVDRRGRLKADIIEACECLRAWYGKPQAEGNSDIEDNQTRPDHSDHWPHAHLINKFPGAGDPEKFELGTTKFVTEEEAKQVLIDAFVRPHLEDPTYLQPIILVGHAVENEFEHILEAFGVDLLSYGTIVKVIDTQAMAKDAGILGPKGPLISLGDLISHFNLTVPNLHSAGNDAAATLMAAVLVSLKEVLYPGVGANKPPAIVEDINIPWVVSALLTDYKSPAPI